MHDLFGGAACRFGLFQWSTQTVGAGGGMGRTQYAIDQGLAGGKRAGDRSSRGGCAGPGFNAGGAAGHRPRGRCRRSALGRVKDGGCRGGKDGLGQG